MPSGQSLRLVSSRRGAHRRDVWTEAETTLRQWLERSLDAVPPATVRWKTLSTDRRQMQRHVVPTLSAMPLSRLARNPSERTIGASWTRGARRTWCKLRKHHRVQREKRLAAGPAWNPASDLVFPMSSAGRWTRYRDWCGWKGCCGRWVFDTSVSTKPGSQPPHCCCPKASTSGPSWPSCVGSRSGRPIGAPSWRA